MISLKNRRTAIVIVLFILLVGLAAASISLGSIRIPVGELVQILVGGGKDTYRLIVIDLRLPRVVAAILIGSALAVSGAVLQGVIRNPLASPDLLGISGGASVAALGFMTLYAGRFSIHWVPLLAIAGAFAAAFTIYLLAWKRGVSPYRLVLIGIGISTAMGALTTFILISGPSYLASQLLGWMTGTVYGTSWKHVAALVPWIALFIPLAMARSRELNVQALGDGAAIGLGSAIQSSRLLLIVYSVALSGASVGIAGTISFIGLMAPHMARRLVGPTHGILLPASAIIGSLILVAADLAGRLLFEPLDIPAGVFTAGIGAPFFLFLLFRGKKMTKR